MKRRACHTGFTLIELLLCLSLLALLLGNYSYTSISQSLRRHDIDDAMLELDAAIRMGRLAAINENITVTFCRSDDGQHCQGSWNAGSILFTDGNGDHVLNGNDRLLFRFPPLKPAGTLTFNAFRNRQYLQLTSRGLTDSQNGNFTFCPADGDARFARQMIINVTGRTRMARDTNNDGIVEDSQGKPVQC
jgi:type IV fimbrial biogenesis protein FimT